MSGQRGHPAPARRRGFLLAFAMPLALLAALAGAAFAMPLDRDAQISALATCQGRYEAAGHEDRAGRMAAMLADLVRNPGLLRGDIRQAEQVTRRLLDSGQTAMQGQAAARLRVCDTLLEEPT